MNTSRISLVFHTLKNHFKKIPLKYRAPAISLFGVFAGSYAIYSRPSLFHLEENKTPINIPLESNSRPLLTEITPLTFKEVMHNKKDKLIFFSNKDFTDSSKDYIELVVSSMQDMFPLEAYYLDLRTFNDQLKQYFEAKNIQINIEDNYNFILINQFSDHWF